MQIFELHFNPKIKDDYTFETFMHEPENISERKLGELYQAGEIKNAIPKKSLDFLAGISKTIRKSYYSSEIKEQEGALLGALKKANEHLSDEIKTGNVNWLGNFNYTALSLKESKLVFTVTGDIKVALIRSGKFIDIGRELNLKEIEPYPLKVFFNTASGKISENDTLFVATKEVYIFLREQGVLASLAKHVKIETAEIKKQIPQSLFSKGEGRNIAGFLMILSSASKNGKKNTFEMLFQREGKKDKSPRLFSFSLLVKKMKRAIREIKLPTPKIKVSVPIIEKLIREKKPKKKIIILVASFILLLTIGFLTFKVASPKKEVVNPAPQEEKIKGLETIIILNEKELEFTPERISLFGSDLYIHNSNSVKLAKINLDSKSLEKTELGKNILKIDANSESPILLSKDGIYYFSDEGWTEKEIGANLENFLFASYLSNLYFLNKETCQIIKSSYLDNSNWGSIKNWPVNKNYCSHPKSMAIDGSVWIVSQNNSILRYYAGEFQEKILLSLSPAVQNLDEMETRTGLPYLYFSESSNNRIIVAEKLDGKIVKQFQGKELNNIKDFSISRDGKVIYILNGFDIYMLTI